jgi:hypothetical protein
VLVELARIPRKVNVAGERDGWSDEISNMAAEATKPADHKDVLLS